MYLIPQPLSSHSVDPPDCTILCSFVPNSTPVVNEDQAIDEVGVAQPTCIVIHDEYDWEPEYQPTVKDDLLLSAPPPLFPNIFSDSAISDFPCVNPSMDVSTADHSQNTPDVSPSFDSREDKSFVENPLDSSFSFFINTEGEHSCFSSTPLHYSSNHEDANKHPEFSDHGCCDLCTSTFDHDVDSLVVNMSRPLGSDDLLVNESKTP